jgi:K+-sensing histidine kinase KdpD
MVGSKHVKGTGLGLSICKAIVAAHGGTFKVLSTVGKGTTISVRMQANLPAPLHERVHVDFIGRNQDVSTGATS